MTYTALYRQFRPQSFAELVGQEHISTTLINSIRTGKIAHAYLFSGPRGTGKTSSAKIFAKALNCLEPLEGEPCNSCSNCIKITEGNSLDVIEIDAASNRGIDEIRELREKVKYSPAEGKYKVYIIDEVHMLTTEAFNALLKTLEEPPRHIIFVLATTEAHKLPATIISRCQRFDFKRITFKHLLEQMKKVAADMGISVEDKAAVIIAKKAEGGMRDALSLLDQSAAFGNGNVTYDIVLEILGAVRETEMLNLLEFIINQQPAELLESIERYIESGKDLKIILHELQDTVRNLILVKLTKNKSENMDEEIFTQMLVLANKSEISRLYKILENLAETENAMKYAAQARITLEIGLLRSMHSSKSAEKDIMPSSEGKKSLSEAIAPKAEVKKPLLEKPSLEKADVNLTEAWQKLLEETKKAKKTLHAFLVEGNPITFSNNIFKIEFDHEKTFHYQQIISQENMKLITSCIHKLWGDKAKAEFVLLSDQPDNEDLAKKVEKLFGKGKVQFID